MSVHYKFKSSLDFDTVTFDGLHISVNDFRKAVVQQKRLGKTNDFELQITNAQTKEVYENDNDLIPKNTSLIISRIPQTSKKPRDSQSQNAPTVCHVPKFDSNTLDLSQMNASEEDKIQAMMAQSTVDYDPRGYQKIRGPGQTGEVPPTYRCYKCHQTGHWIKNCPLPHSSVKKSDIRRNTGIPKSFLQDKDVEKEDSAAEEIVIVPKQAEVPDELLCSICKDIFRDAVMIPCCGSSFCDDCVRTALVDSEENECPDCKEKGTSPGSLIPNRFLRSSVNTFKNETGYERRRKNNGVQEVVTTSAPVEVVTTSEESVPKAEPVPEMQERNASASPEKKLPESVPKTSDGETTPPKLSPKKEEPAPVKKEEKKEKKEIESTKQEDEEENYFDKEEHRRRRSRERDSPRRHPEVVIPQHEPSHNSDIQARPDDTYNQNNPQSFSNYGPMVHDMPHRSNTTDSYPVRSDSYMRHAKPNQGVGPPHMGYMNNYGNRNERYCYPRDSYNMNSAPYPYNMQNQRYRQMAPHSNIPPYYQGMAGEIGPGIIEDPLDAFNRIMKEKEKRKEMKRLASERHLSRSMGTKSRGPRDPSPIVEKRSRHRVSPVNDRRNRSPLRQEKISSHRNIERDKNVRSHRGHYPSNKRSFSRSNSPPPQRRYSKSPVRRRSRSRSHPRSHSRDMELLRQHDSRASKHVVQQIHRPEYDREVQRYNKKSSGRFSETRSVSEAGPKENRRHNSKMRENGNQLFETYPSTHQSSRKAFIETDNMPEFRDMQHEFHEKKRRASLSRSEDGGKIVKKRDNGEGRHHAPPAAVEPVRHEVEKKSKERKKKKDKDEKSEKKSKKDKKEKKKRERHKDDHKKHSEHKKSRKEPESIEAANAKEDDVNKNSSDSRKDSSKFANEESLDDRQETFTPDINITRHLEADDQIMDEQQKEGDSIPSEDNFSKTEKSPVLFKGDRYKQIADNTCSELNTPTSFVDTTPENYAGKWDNFDFSIPNSEEIRAENERDSEYDSHLLQLSHSPPMRTDHFEPSRHLGKKKDVFSRLQPRNEDMMFKEKRSDPATKATPPRRPSPTPSEAKSSSSNVSKSHSKKRRKKSKHKKDHKRSSSAESSKNSRGKSVSKHKKSRSEKKKKTKRNESR